METELRRLQLTQLEILKLFDRICKQYNLNYSLYAGSLLGAVRHQGFIPWDDDLDVCMPREDYEKFLAVWDKAKPEGYLLQNKENVPEFSQSFSKIRKDHTTFLQYEWEAGKYHTGIFFDIFPIDRLPNGKWELFWYKWHCMYYQLLTREFVPPKGSPMIKLGSKILLACTPKRSRPHVRSKQLKKITKYNSNHSLHTVGIETMDSLCHPFDADMLDKYTTLKFEDADFMCFAGWDTHLRHQFGDYMQLPPVEERTWTHHPIIIDFEHNYEELSHEL